MIYENYLITSLETRRMEWDRQRESEKQAELLRQLSSALRQAGVAEPHIAETAQAVFDTYVFTQPPEAARTTISFITMSSMGRGGGESTKAGNIKLNIGKLIDTLASGTLTAVGAAQLPWTIPLAALVIWNSLWRTAQIAISETEASVLYTMWVHKNADRDVPNDGLLGKCNALLEKYGRPQLSKQILQDALRRLESIDTIERSPRNPTMWWLREWVKVTYR